MNEDEMYYMVIVPGLGLEQALEMANKIESDYGLDTVYVEQED